MRSVLITGTSSGIGLVTAARLSAAGWRVIAAMRDPARGQALAAATRAFPENQRPAVIALDVTKPPSIEAGVAATLELTHGRLDAVVHNAGIAIGAAFEDLPDTQARAIMETNFFGVLGLTKALLPTFRAQRSGRIILISSDSAFAGEPTNSVYCASKWALEGWAESLAYEVGPFGIKVVLVEPGPYRTGIWTARIEPAGSPYRPMLDVLNPAVEKGVATLAREPGEVAARIEAVLTQRTPRFRNPVGPVAVGRYFVRGKIPSVWLQYFTARSLGLLKVKL